MNLSFGHLVSGDAAYLPAFLLAVFGLIGLIWVAVWLALPLARESDEKRLRRK